ncbi:MAG: sialate O-acetylesterase [Planctomycetota bacterium]
MASVAALVTAALPLAAQPPAAPAPADTKTVRVFLFAGQSNMVGSDSKAADVAGFPPFAHDAEPQPDVRFWYVLGREDKKRSKGWVVLQPVDGIVGPELSFARAVAAATKAPLAIVKVAAGGTTLGKDWNPDQPGGFELYPLALATVRAALAALDAQHVRWRLEGFVWHQGENDMFDPAFRPAYAANLARFIACWRRDLSAPQLRFFVGELCTKTIWGMDNRAPMHAIEQAQRQVAARDPLVDYVPTSQVGVEIGGGVGLHYHYGTLGQLEHGASHARAYLQSIGAWQPAKRPLRKWPYAVGTALDLYVLAGHRNMEGERAFVQQLSKVPGGRALAQDRAEIAFRYVTGGGVHGSDGWEPLGPAGLHDTFGPELSFGRALARQSGAPFALAKFTHSGSQIVDWTPAGSAASTRNLYAPFLAFVRAAIADLEDRGHRVRLAGIVYHLGENDMSWTPHRRQAAKWLGELIAGSRRDLGLPELRWFVSQQRPTDHADVNAVDVVAEVRALAVADPHVVYVEAFDPPPQAEQLVFDTAGVAWLGERLAAAVQAAGR